MQYAYELYCKEPDNVYFSLNEFDNKQTSLQKHFAEKFLTHFEKRDLKNFFEEYNNQQLYDNRDYSDVKRQGPILEKQRQELSKISASASQFTVSEILRQTSNNKTVDSIRELYQSNRLNDNLFEDIKKLNIIDFSKRYVEFIPLIKADDINQAVRGLEQKQKLEQQNQANTSNLVPRPAPTVEPSHDNSHDDYDSPSPF